MYINNLNLSIFYYTQFYNDKSLIKSRSHSEAQISLDPYEPNRSAIASATGTNSTNIKILKFKLPSIIQLYTQSATSTTRTALC